MNIDKKIISRLQTMLAEYEKVNGMVSANMRDAINTDCTGGCRARCNGLCAIGCTALCKGMTFDKYK